MKAFVLAFALLAMTATVFAEPPPEMKAMFDACKTEVGITEERPPRPDEDTPKAKCFHACMMKKHGEMADGKIAQDKVIQMASEKMPGFNDEKKAKLTECVTKANGESDECDVAHAFGKCLKDNNLIPPRPPKH